MRLTIYGTGAIGGSLGAYLVRAGEDVLFVDRNTEHVQAINTDGLRIEGIRGEFMVNGQAVVPEELDEELEVVLLAVKSQDTKTAVCQFLPLLTQDSAVVSLQNGLNEELISQLIGRKRTIGAYVNWPADYIGPGHIRLGGEGRLYLGELNGRISPRIERLQRALSAFLPVHLTNNIWGYLWSKQIYGSIQCATALTNLHIYEVVQIPEVRSVLGDLVREAIQVLKALGISLESLNKFEPSLFQDSRDEEAVRRIADAVRVQSKTKTGIWRDIAVRKRKTEVDWIVGATVRKGEEIGLSLPLNRRLMEMIHELEEGKRSMDVANFKELEVLKRK
jgi:2-dehydropantoate 2-reductase